MMKRGPDEWRSDRCGRGPGLNGVSLRGIVPLLLVI